MSAPVLWIGMNARGVGVFFSAQPVFDGQEWKPADEDAVYDIPVEDGLTPACLKPGQCIALAPVDDALDLKVQAVVEAAREVRERNTTESTEAWEDLDAALRALDGMCQPCPPTTHRQFLTISDDDLCADCGHLDYHPGESSQCVCPDQTHDESEVGHWWPCTFNAQGYAVSCPCFSKKKG